MYVLKKIILKSFKKKSENDYFYYYLIYMLLIIHEYIGTLSIYQKNVQWYNFVLTTEQPWVIWILKQILLQKPKLMVVCESSVFLSEIRINQPHLTNLIFRQYTNTITLFKNKF